MNKRLIELLREAILEWLWTEELKWRTWPEVSKVVQREASALLEALLRKLCSRDEVIGVGLEIWMKVLSWNLLEWVRIELDIVHVRLLQNWLTRNEILLLLIECLKGGLTPWQVRDKIRLDVLKTILRSKCGHIGWENWLL